MAAILWPKMVDHSSTFYDQYTLKEEKVYHLWVSGQETSRNRTHTSSLVPSFQPIFPLFVLKNIAVFELTFDSFLLQFFHSFVFCCWNDCILNLVILKFVVLKSDNWNQKRWTIEKLTFESYDIHDVCFKLMPTF